MTTGRWDERMVSELDHWHREENKARQQKRRIVRELRAQGCPWSVIGQALGVTKQTAHEKYRDA